ncbi:MAG: efflux RND transporter permease subunit, partial [Phycisphaerae bacterium]|nr:efflux RND transporter permease subunit [Phycisphaerae bacterium]
MIVSDHAIRNRTTVLVLVILIVAGGTMSYIALPRESAPDVPIPRVIISTTYKGVSPEDIESSITIKIEKELTGLKGLKEISSTSAEGVSTVIVEFLPDIRIEDALQYVRDKVDQVKAALPTDSKDFTDPVIR